jgi:acyl transferase domain-containing protein
MTDSALSPVKRALLAVQELKARLDAVTRARTEPIAIVGMACRLPGGSSTPEAYWRFIVNGGDAVSRVPAERWRTGTDVSSPEDRAMQWGAFLQERIDRFEPEFFGITPREAASLDPQQRLVLEVAWESLERAGQRPEELMGSRTGVFLGLMTDDYQQAGYANPELNDPYTFTGNGHCFPPGRLSYVLGLQGPSMCVDTACSSSLVAVHLACQSLRNEECTMAIAGGVALHLSQTTMHVVARTHALSPDGRCKTFDARANGYVRGEGCGMVVLKRLSDAQRDGDTILAVIRGSAVNQDGRSTGLTAPNVRAQQAMLRQALQSAQVAPQDVSYVETHGTGTSLGDPIEFEALNEVIGRAHGAGSQCVLGAVKTNIGHLEAAAGIAGLIKLVLCLQNESIPGNMHYRQLNPRISLEGTPFVIPTKPVAWKRGSKARIAGVSGFGMSGTNAHVIVEEAPQLEATPVAEVGAGRLQVLPISAKHSNALTDLARAYQHYFAQLDESEAAGDRVPALAETVYTASTRRAHYEHRLAVVGRTRGEMASALGGFLRGEITPGSSVGSAVSAGTNEARRKVVFVFPGQGSQWLGMGRA